MSHQRQRPKSTNHLSQLLSNAENSQLFKIIGNRCVVSGLSEVSAYRSIERSPWPMLGSGWHSKGAGLVKTR